MKGFNAKSVYDMDTDDGSLLWSITLENTSGNYLEFGDVGLPMPWNNKYASIDDTYNNRTTVHTFAGADSGYAYAIRCSGEGNYVMFTPVTDTGARIEYIDNWTGNINGVKGTRSGSTYQNWTSDTGGWFPGLQVYYIHSKDIQKTGRGYYTDATSLVLKPGEKKTYQFKFSAVRAGDNTPQNSAEDANNASDSVEERENNMRSILYKEGMIEVDLLGKIYREYMIPGGQHHDFVELPDGNLLVASDSPDLSTVEDYVVEIDRETGAVVWELDMKDLISQEDGQSASMDSDGSEEADWFHNNGLAYDAENDLVLLSARHKDAIVAVNKEDKSLAWILGDPTGWDGVDPSYFFTPEGEDFEWFYAQHNVSILDNGDIALFDNGTAKVKRVDGDNRVSGDNVYSRAVVYQIDTENMTVSQVTEYGKERGADWYSDWISGVVSLDGTQDHLWITAGSHLHSDEENRSDYYPKDMFVQGLTKTTHIDQVDNGELSFELTISGDTYNALTYRSFRMPLYTEGKYDPSAVPEVLGSLGETSYEESSIDVSTAEALPDGWNFLLDGSKISVNGSFLTQTAAADLQAGKLILISGESQRAYQLTQTPSEGDDGTNVTVKGWTAVDGLEGQEWNIYLELDGVLYNTGYMYSQA